MSLTKVRNAQKQLQDYEARYKWARQNLRKAVREARKQHTLAEIGQVLGMSRQAVYELLKR